jgi:hypothetical protein
LPKLHNLVATVTAVANAMSTRCVGESSILCLSVLPFSIVMPDNISRSNTPTLAIKALAHNHAYGDGSSSGSGSSRSDSISIGRKGSYIGYISLGNGSRSIGMRNL